MKRPRYEQITFLSVKNKTTQLKRACIRRAMLLVMLHLKVPQWKSKNTKETALEGLLGVGVCRAVINTLLTDAHSFKEE